MTCTDTRAPSLPRVTWPRRTRFLRRPATATLLVVLAVIAGLVLATGTGQATVPARGAEDPDAARAVADLTGENPGPGRVGSRLPVAYLAATAGTSRHPAVVDGMLLDPGGGCSSPIALPAAFDDACRAHDLGYDLLRYANRRGAPLGGWARAALDRQLARDLAAACTETFATRGVVDLTRCHVVAGLADVVVAANSWRQGWSVPVVEHGPFERDPA
ncbi:hypothetical protein [Actinomycetospora sp. NBRC 106375]|uniref:hypothetical protein n=1 Tax=Actinomycetospora sp. NBRC 106375 TaxID=3032207 RepID=UPI0025567B0C|nr:hypothetical protein [Actinomycetospora sp. NBRC 106375]